MNFKTVSLCVLSLSLISLSPEVFAAKKSASEEIKNLQFALLKSRNSIDTLLNTKAHQINKETESMISGPGAGNFTSKQPIYGAVRQMTLDAVKKDQPESLFAGSDAMENLLKNYRMSSDDRIEAIVNPTEKVYSLTVLNPENLAPMIQMNDRLKKEVGHEDDLLERLTRLVDLSIKGKRYVTFKEAEVLTNQIYKMNADLQEMEELAIKLPSKDQKAVETFRVNMSEWLNKKLVFTEVNKKGFSVTMDFDSYASLDGQGIATSGLNKNYTAENIAASIKTGIKHHVTDRYRSERWDDFRFYVVKNNRRTEQKMTMKDMETLDVKLSADRLRATISTAKFSFENNISYSRTVKMFFLQDEKAFYDHNAQMYTDYYTPNSSLVRAELKLVVGHEIQMKNIYKNFGLEKFGTDLGKIQFTAK